jgi:hypothetical protein
MRKVLPPPSHIPSWRKNSLHPFRAASLNILGAQSPVAPNWQYHTYMRAIVSPWFVVNHSLLLRFATHQFKNAVYVIEDGSEYC